jgi:hypothetical protein
MRLLPRLSRLGRTALLLALCLLIPACASSKVTRANYDKITNNMTLKDVEAVLGPGEKEQGDGSGVAAQFGVDVSPPPASKAVEKYVWESGNKSITVYFTNGRVSNKSESGLGS